MLAIWRAAAVKPANAVCQTQSGHRSGAPARPIVGKPDSYARRAEATSRRTQICWSEAWSGPHSDEAQHAVCQAYREVSFAGEPSSNKISATLNHNDLPRSGSKTCGCGVSDPIRAQVWGRCVSHRRQAGLLRPSGRSEIPAYTNLLERGLVWAAFGRSSARGVSGIPRSQLRGRASLQQNQCDAES